MRDNLEHTAVIIVLIMMATFCIVKFNDNKRIKEISTNNAKMKAILSVADTTVIDMSHALDIQLNGISVVETEKGIKLYVRDSQLIVNPVSSNCIELIKKDSNKMQKKFASY